MRPLEHVAASLLPAFIVAVVVLAAAGCDERRADRGPTSVAVSPVPQESGVAAAKGLPPFTPELTNAFQPLPEALERPILDDAARLGQMLWFDRRLSRGGDVACSSCHDLARAGADGVAVATGTHDHKGQRNTPTILNAAGAFAQGWDARASTVGEYVLPHVLDAAVMAQPDETHFAEVVASIPGYVAAFRKAFPEEKPSLTAETVGRALGTFTAKLFARSRWDRYLAGDKAAVTDAELGGLAMFVAAGCPSCHQGKYLGATQAQKLGVARAWPPPAGTDRGRFEVTRQEADRGMFKVPTLRNVARTAPYLHDGSIPTLEETVRLMARHQVGRELDAEQVGAIVLFLSTLNGDAAKEVSVAPVLPPSGPKTPKPE